MAISSPSPMSSTTINATSAQSPLPANATSTFSPVKIVSPRTNGTTIQSPPPSASPSPPPPTETSPPPPSPPADSLPPPPSPPPKSPTPPSSPPPQEPEKVTPPPPQSQPSPPPPVAASPPKKSPSPPFLSPTKSPSPPPPGTPPPPLSPSPPPPIRPQGLNAQPSHSPPVPTLSPPSPSNVSTSPPPSNATTNSTGGKTPETPPSSSDDEGLSTEVVAAIGAVFGVVFLVVIAVVFLFLRRRKKKKRPRSKRGYIVPTSRLDSPHSDSGLLKGGITASRYVSTTGSDLVYSPSKRGFTYEELFEATYGFSKPNLIGEGGFGSVYKGYLPDGKEVAVKQLKIGGGQGEREFKAEVEIINRIHHRHLVSLAGYCIWESGRLLVYEYVPNNNLHFHLHGEGRPVMEWATRVKIAAGAARGITYLHEDCHPRVIHRDIKSSNILLDNNFEAKVSDFGLAKLAADANTHISTRVVGTFGYMAPEYASTGKLTEKSDVYSFGVVLLELITGRKPVDRDENLVEWGALGSSLMGAFKTASARPLLNKALETAEFEGLADPKLDKNYVNSEMLQVVEVAAACVRHSALKRPRMGQVVRAFESTIASDITNGVPVGDSEILPQSSEIRWFQKMAFGNQDFSTDFLGRNDSFNRSRSSRSSHQV